MPNLLFVLFVVLVNLLGGLRQPILQVTFLMPIGHEVLLHVSHPVLGIIWNGIVWG